MKSSIEVGQFHRSWKRYVEVGNIMLLNNLSKLRSAFSILLKTETFSLHSLKFRLFSLKFPDFSIFPTTMSNYIYVLHMTHRCEGSESWFEMIRIGSHAFNHLSLNWLCQSTVGSKSLFLSNIVSVKVVHLYHVILFHVTIKTRDPH